MKRNLIRVMTIMLCTLMTLSTLTVTSTALASLGKKGEAIVFFEKGSSQSININSVKVSETVKLGGKITASKVVSDSYSSKQLVKLLSKCDNVKYVSQNLKLKIKSHGNDFSSYQWALKNNGDNGGISGKDTGLSAVDYSTLDKTERVIAVVDTGVDYTHKDLKDSMWNNPYTRELPGKHGYDFCNEDEDPMDDGGHGTHCAGIIAADRNNGLGVKGVSDNTKIMSLKMFDVFGSGDVYSLFKAYSYIYHALKLGVNIVAINNSWGLEVDVNDEEAFIFEEDLSEIENLNSMSKEIFDAVGQKGAVSVFAAGNSGKDTNDLVTYPDCDSEYVIMVASTDEKGKLSPFSNYNKEKIHVAAPGSDILSTINTACYNPSIYNIDRSKKANNICYSFDNKINPAKYIDNTEDDIKLELTSEDFFGKRSTKSASLKMTVNNAQARENYTVYIPYTSAKNKTDNTMKTYSSFMYKQNSDVNCEVCFSDLSKKEFDKVKSGEVIPTCLDEGYVEDTQCWMHMYYENSFVKKSEEERYFVINVSPTDNGSFELYIDDFACSNWILPSDKDEIFAKYDYMSGTSMATPFVSGALSLLKGMYPDYNSEQLVSALYSIAVPNENLRHGIIDFRNLNKPLSILMSVKQKDESIVITGAQLGEEKGKITIDGEEIDSEAISWSDKEITLPTGDISNKTVKIKIEVGDTVFERTLFVKGVNKAFTSIGKINADVDSGTMALTDGKYLYLYNSYLSEFSKYKLTQKGLTATSDYMRSIDYGKIFKSEIKEALEVNTDSMFTPFGVGDISDIDGGKIVSEFCCLDNKLYAVAKLNYNSVDFYKIVSYDIIKNKWEAVTTLPADEEAYKYGYSSLAVYNGNLYLAGGYDISTKSASTMFRCYNLDKKTWENSVPLPTGRYASIYKQVGDMLIAVYGSDSDGEVPKTAVFDGKSWTETATPPMPESTAYLDSVRNIGKYPKVQCSATKTGLIFTTDYVETYGDTFVYNLSKGEFECSGYTAGDIDNTYVTFALGDKYYLINKSKDSEKSEFSSIDIKSSCFEVASGKGKYSVTGTGCCLPGDYMNISVKPAKNHFIKAVYVNGKKIKGTTYKCLGTKDIKVTAKTGAYVTKVTLNKSKLTLKAGKKYTLKAKKILPKDANSKKLVWKSSNKKYATVTSKGVVKTKKAGKGKTVTITVTAADRKLIKATCKIKIK